MCTRMFSFAALLMMIGCAEAHPADDAEVSDSGATDGDSDASTTVCDFLITDTAPCPADCLSIYGLVLDPAATCVDEVTPRGVVWCATQGSISSFLGDCYLLPDGTRVDVQWTPMNQPSDTYCNLPACRN